MLSKEKIIQNAKRAARRDGYDQIVIACPDGTFSFCRDYPDVAIGQGEQIVGRVLTSWELGMFRVNYRKVKAK